MRTIVNSVIGVLSVYVEVMGQYAGKSLVHRGAVFLAYDVWVRA